jgi:hypothetical protein
MRILGMTVMAAVLAGLVVPVQAQNSTPHINMLSDQPSKTPEERAADEERDKAYRESLRKIPDAKASSDPWGTVRSNDAPKAPPAKSTASAKPKKTGNSAN